jgi:hypothetical protein
MRQARRFAMLPVSITLLLLAVVITAFSIFGTIGGGGIIFAAGFALLGTIALLQFWRGHRRMVSA